MFCSKKNLSVLAIVSLLMYCNSNLLIARPDTAINIGKPTPNSLLIPTNKALLGQNEAGIALQFKVNSWDETATMFFSDLWISTRKNGEVHFVYKGEGNEQRRVILLDDKPKLLTCVINYSDNQYTCYANGKKAVKTIELNKFPLGSSLQTLELARKGTTMVETISAMLSLKPFDINEVKELNSPSKGWKPFVDTSLLIKDTKKELKPGFCSGVLCKFDSLASYDNAIKKAYPQQFLFVDQKHPQASDTNSGSDADSPLKTIDAAIKKLMPNTTLFISKGVYPESLFINVSGISKFQPIVIKTYPGEENEVIIRGADRITGWQKVGDDIWKKTDWTAQWAEFSKGHPGWDSGKPPYNYVKKWRRSWKEHLFLNGQDLMHVDLYKNLQDLSFWIDKDKQVCFIKLLPGQDPNSMFLEAARRKNGIQVAGDYIHIKNLIVEKFTQAGIHILGSHNLIEDTTARYCLEGIGVGGVYNELHGVRAIYNGQVGFTGPPRKCRIINCYTAFNNTKGTNPCYHCGGVKLCGAKDVVIRGMLAEYNGGPGIWFDVDNEDVLVENCMAIGNYNAGIFIEISPGPTMIRNNISVNNATGISIAESQNATVINNTCCYNNFGFSGRSAVKGSDIWNIKNLKLFNNIFAFNTEGQIDGRNWTYIKELNSDPQTMNYQSDNNILWSGDSKVPLIKWNRKKKIEIFNLKDKPADFVWEQNSKQVDPGFCRQGLCDFSISIKSPAAGMGKSHPGVKNDFYGRKSFQSDIGAIQSRFNPIWSYRTYDGEKEANLFPLPN